MNIPHPVARLSRLGLLALVVATQATGCQPAGPTPARVALAESAATAGPAPMPSPAEGDRAR